MNKETGTKKKAAAASNEDSSAKCPARTAPPPILKSIKKPIGNLLVITSPLLFTKSFASVKVTGDLILTRIGIPTKAKIIKKNRSIGKEHKVLKEKRMLEPAQNMIFQNLSLLR